MRSHETSRRAQLQRELEDVEARLGRLLDALADGVLVGDEIRTRLTAEKARKEKVTTALERLDHLAVITSVDPKDLERDLKERVADVTAVLGRQTVQASQMLRKILADKIEFEPVGSGRRRSYKFRGALTLAKLVSGEAFALLAENTPDCGGPNGIRTRVSALRERPTVSTRSERERFLFTPMRGYLDSRLRGRKWK